MNRTLAIIGLIILIFFGTCASCSCSKHVRVRPGIHIGIR